MKVGGPLMSMEARGKIGERLVFSKRSSGQQARFQKAQKDVTTTTRTIQRNFYNTAVGMWNALTENEKDVFRVRAENLHMTGYNLYMKETIATLSASYLHITGGSIELTLEESLQLSLFFSANIEDNPVDSVSVFVNGNPYVGDVVFESVNLATILFILSDPSILSTDTITVSYNGNSNQILASVSLQPCPSFSNFSIENQI